MKQDYFYEIFVNGNQFVKKYKQTGRALSAARKLAEDRSAYVEVWAVYSGKRTLFAYYN